MNDMTQPITGFTQTDRAVHRDWSRLTRTKPYAAALLHELAAHVGDTNSVTASYKTLAELMDVSVMTVRRAASVLAELNYLQIIRIGSGGVNSYVLNSRVIWAEKRDGLRHARFTSTILASSSEQQDETQLDNLRPLLSVPAPHGTMIDAREQGSVLSGAAENIKGWAGNTE